MTKKERSEKMKAIWAKRKTLNVLPNGIKVERKLFLDAQESKTLEVVLSKKAGIMQHLEIHDARGNILNYKFEKNTNINIQEV